MTDESLFNVPPGDTARALTDKERVNIRSQFDDRVPMTVELYRRYEATIDERDARIALLQGQVDKYEGVAYVTHDVFSKIVDERDTLRMEVEDLEMDLDIEMGDLANHREVVKELRAEVERLKEPDGPLEIDGVPA